MFIVVPSQSLVCYLSECGGLCSVSQGQLAVSLVQQADFLMDWAAKVRAVGHLNRGFYVL